MTVQCGITVVVEEYNLVVKYMQNERKHLKQLEEFEKKNKK